MAEPDQPADPYAAQIERFHVLFDRSPSFAAVLVGAEHRFLLANPAFARLVAGRSIVGLALVDALPELRDQGFVELLDTVAASGEAHVGHDVAVVIAGQGGGERWLDFVLQPIHGPEGAVAAIFVDGTDVTQRHAASETLRASEAQSRQILDSAIDTAIIATDLDGRVTRWSRGAAEIFGWSEAEMLGQTTERILPREDPGASASVAERWHMRRCGTRFWASGAVSALRDDSGMATGFVTVVRDRTAEHEAIEALRTSEARLRRAQQAGGVGVFSLAVGDALMETSAEFCRIFGLEPRSGIPPALAESLVLPEDAGKASDETRRRTGDLPLDVEYRIRRADDGAVRTIARRAELERDADGAPVRMLGVVQDVTEQRAAQAAVAESEAKFRAFTEAVPNQVWSATPEGRLDWANARTFDYDGADQQRLDAEGWETQVHPDDLARAGAAWAHSIATGAPYETEFRLRRADGAYRWHLARAVALRAAEGADGAEGAIERWIGTNTDIDDARRAREALDELNATLEQRVEERTRERDRAWKNSRDLQAVLEETGVFRAINDAWTDVLGYAVDEVVGRSFLDFIHPEDHNSSMNALGSAREAALPVYENRYRHKDGGWRWLSWVAAPEGGLIYASGRHVTAEKDAAERLAAAEDQLRQSQKMDAVGQLTGGVAHDFNNLLTVIRGSVDLLRREDLAPERRARYVDAIGTTADRAAKLTGQLLSFARRQALTPELLDAGESLQEVAGMLRTLAGSRVVLDVVVPEERCFILADRSQFDTAIVNLGINARDAMDGSGALTIATRPVAGIPPLRGHAAVAGDFIAVTVADDGGGIAPGDLDRIFEPFFTTKPVGEGTGLGLSQVIGFAKQSGGDIRVDSAVGRGTTFTLYLPRTYPDGTERPRPAPAEPVAGDGVCVLVVEDNEQVGAFAGDALAELGYATVLATDAQAALALLADDGARFQIVFSDVVMPGMSGLELGAEIRRLYPALAVVLTSGYSHVLAQEGTHGFELLHKPYSVEQLSRVLRQAVSWHRSQAAV